MLIIKITNGPLEQKNRKVEECFFSFEGVYWCHKAYFTSLLKTQRLTILFFAVYCLPFLTWPFQVGHNEYSKFF